MTQCTVKNVTTAKGYKARETASHNFCCQISLQENLPTSHAVDEQK